MLLPDAGYHVGQSLRDCYLEKGDISEFAFYVPRGRCASVGQNLGKIVLRGFSDSMSITGITTAEVDCREGHCSVIAGCGGILAAMAGPALIALLAPTSCPRWLVMWLVIAAIYFSLKVLTLSTARLASVPDWRKWAYLFAWPGMNARQFFAPRRLTVEAWPISLEYLESGVNVLAGGLVFWATSRWIPPSSKLVVGWAGMIGTILMFHFGGLHLVSCAWRAVGIDARPLMNRPTRATSVAQFWGRRWNTAFRDVTHEFLFRPLTARFGPTMALVIGFVFSGLLHEVVISLPAGGGYGGPLAFFCIQAAALMFERSSVGRTLGLGSGWRGWLFTAVVLLAPVRLLFHDLFVLRVVVPFMEKTGAA